MNRPYRMIRVAAIVALSFGLLGADSEGCVDNSIVEVQCESNADCSDDFSCNADHECVQTACTCTAEYAPVCGIDGETYSSACFAACAGVGVSHESECEPDECTAAEGRDELMAVCIDCACDCGDDQHVPYGGCFGPCDAIPPQVQTCEADCEIVCEGL